MTTFVMDEDILESLIEDKVPFTIYKDESYN